MVGGGGTLRAGASDERSGTMGRGGTLRVGASDWRSGMTGGGCGARVGTGGRTCGSDGKAGRVTPLLAGGGGGGGSAGCGTLPLAVESLSDLEEPCCCSCNAKDVGGGGRDIRGDRGGGLCDDL